MWSTQSPQGWQREQLPDVDYLILTATSVTELASHARLSVTTRLLSSTYVVFGLKPRDLDGARSIECAVGCVIDDVQPGVVEVTDPHVSGPVDEVLLVDGGDGHGI